MIGPIQIGTGLALIGLCSLVYFSRKIRSDRLYHGLEERILHEMIDRERRQISERQADLDKYDFQRRNIDQALRPNASIDLSLADKVN